MIPYAELESFFCDLVAQAQGRGIPCGITSGMACVHFGVAATTKDCDVLCLPEKSGEFRDLIAATELRGLLPTYRGNISPPLDARWMRGGWTSHFTWKTKPEETCLDVFGIAPRGSSAWEEELLGLYASRHIVAEMKRTNRGKDWPYITALGVKMLKMGDARGTLHLYEPFTLAAAVEKEPPTSWMLKARPSLQLALSKDGRLEAAIHAETVFWHRLDACRIALYERALRPYVSAVRRAIARREMSLAESHALRLECAAAHLPPSPVGSHGFGQLVLDARAATESMVHPSLMEWLPNGLAHFIGMQ
jgi:hypothetical protein